jgi:hypothetical protein
MKKRDVEERYGRERNILKKKGEFNARLGIHIYSIQGEEGKNSTIKAIIVERG